MPDQVEQLQRRLDQFRSLAEGTTDPLATRLVGDLISELEEQLTKTVPRKDKE
jgi:hypothetical protein